MKFVWYMTFLLNAAVALNTWRIKQNETSSNTIKSYLKTVLEVYNPRSLVVVSTPENLDDWISSFYELGTPLYKLSLTNIKTFNGKYHMKYDVNITFEENKIYTVISEKLFENEWFLHKLQTIYFWRQRDKVLILIRHEFKTEQLKRLKRLMFLCWKNKVLNIAFAFVGTSITTITFNPFTGNISFSENNNIFPDKLRNLYGHKINVSMFSNILDAIPSGSEFKGRDGLMASTVEQILNATFTYIGPMDGVDYGENLGGRRMSGVFGDVANGRTEIAFNSRYLKGEFENLLEATYPHGRDDLTGLVPVVKPSDVKDFGRNFSSQIWLLLMATQLLLFCLICVLTTITQHEINPVVIAGVLFRLMLGQPAQYDQNAASVRMVLLSVTYIAFFFEIAYLSQLASVLAVPRKPHQINTLEELADSDLKVYTLPRFKRMLNGILEDPLRRKLVQKLFTYQETEQIDEINEHKHIGAICKEHIAVYVVQQRNNYADDGRFYRIMNEKPMPSIICYGVRYGSPFLEKLNVIIGRLTAAGIPNQWRKLTLEEMSIKGSMYQQVVSSDKNTLTVKNLIHVFYCLVAGWGLGIVALFVEKLLSEMHA